VSALPTLSPAAGEPAFHQPIALVDLLDRVLATGVVVSGDITISVAGVDLIRISLRALLSSIGTLAPATRPGGR
jgi:hypothetical protein